MIPPALKSKIYPNRRQLLVQIDAFRSQGKTLVFTNGCFDIVHPGHIHCLIEAKELGDVLVVGINSDASVRRLKGPGRPVVDERSRTIVVAAFSAVDAVVLFDEDTPDELIAALRPDVLVKGSEYTVEQMDGVAFVKSYGGKIVRIPMLPGYSSTSIINRRS